LLLFLSLADGLPAAALIYYCCMAGVDDDDYCSAVAAAFVDCSLAVTNFIGALDGLSGILLI